MSEPHHMVRAKNELWREGREPSSGPAASFVLLGHDLQYRTPRFSEVKGPSPKSTRLEPVEENDVPSNR